MREINKSEQPILKPKPMYAVNGLIFGISFPILAFVVNSASFFTKQPDANAVKGYLTLGVIGIFLLIWNAIIGFLCGLLLGKIIEWLTKNRKINPILLSPAAGFVWGLLMGILGFGIPVLIISIFIGALSANVFLGGFILVIGTFISIAAIIFIPIFSIIGFLLSVSVSQFLVKRYALGNYQYFLAAVGVASIYFTLASIYAGIGVVGILLK